MLLLYKELESMDGQTVIVRLVFLGGFMSGNRHQPVRWALGGGFICIIGLNGWS